jgi:DNA-binding response OmpR family regulator
MPGLDGPQLCQQIRATPRLKSTYLILLTVKDKSADIVAGLRSEADDYVSKSADLLELHARVQVGVRTVEVHRALAAQAKELEEARALVDRFHGALHLCMSCKKVSDAPGVWQSMEHYFARHMKLRFAHDICPACRRREQGERL